MAATPLPQAGGLGGIMMEGMPPPPGTDLTGICFRDQLWLNSFPLDRNLVFDYFALSPFYDLTCNNEQLRMRSVHPLDISQLSKLTGIEYMLNEVMEPHLFVIRKQKRDGPEKVTPMLTYYVLDGSIYQAPQLSGVFASRMSLVNMNTRISAITLPISDWTRRVFVWQVRALYYISKSFTAAASKLEKIGYDTESDSVKPETKAGAENIDFKEIKRVDQILTALQRKLPPAPPLPPFPEGFAAPSSDTAETQDGQAQNGHSDPIIDQGAAKRLKLEK